jgi:hypothetical protein
MPSPGDGASKSDAYLEGWDKLERKRSAFTRGRRAVAAALEAEFAESSERFLPPAT